MHGVGNPIGAFHLIKRFVELWQNVFLSASDLSSMEKIRPILENADATFPGDNDVTGALESLARLQDVYKLSTEDMSRGQVATEQTAPMTGKEAAVELYRC